MGDFLRARLRQSLDGYEMVKEVRGVGLLNGVEFVPPTSMKLRVPFEAFRQIHPGMFGQVVVMRMFRDKGFLTQMCGNDFMVLKAAPPLMVEERQADAFARALGQVVEEMHTSAGFWTEALGMARRVVNI
jgi:ornithine--oxo-acid transaminase